jgi:uncharacterized membrane protein YtjA (UPF0391 family)
MSRLRHEERAFVHILPASALARVLLKTSETPIARRRREFEMLYWAAVFFVIALIAAVFGFGGIAASAVGVAKVLFFVFLILAIVSLIFGRRVPT